MNAPWYAYGAIGENGALIMAVLIGIAFGWFLERGGLGNARKLMGQFYLTDMTVFKVLFTAVITAMLGAFWLSRLGMLDLGRVYMPETFWVAQLVGGLVFGVGFALGGLCPGTSCVSAATGRKDGLFVIAGMMVGVFAFHELFAWFRPVYDAGALGAITLPDMMGISYGVVILMVTAAALGGFFAAEWLERRAAGAVAEPARVSAVVAVE